MEFIVKTKTSPGIHIVDADSEKEAISLVDPNVEKDYLQLSEEKNETLSIF